MVSDLLLIPLRTAGELSMNVDRQVKSKFL